MHRPQESRNLFTDVQYVPPLGTTAELIAISGPIYYWEVMVFGCPVVFEMRCGAVRISTVNHHYFEHAVILQDMDVPEQRQGSGANRGRSLMGHDHHQVHPADG